MNTPGLHNLLHTHTPVPRPPEAFDERQNIVTEVPLIIHLADRAITATAVLREDDSGEAKAVLEAATEEDNNDLKRALGSTGLVSVSGGEALLDTGETVRVTPPVTVLQERMRQEDGSSTPVFREVDLSE